MREMVIIRVHDHQIVDGVQEYNLEIALPGQFSTNIVGGSAEELKPLLGDVLQKLCNLLKIPETVVRVKEAKPEETIFFDSAGKRIPMSQFAATAKAQFKAEIIRDGKVVQDDE